jgi:hypothetical protein
VAPDERLRDVHVLVAGEVAAGAQEPVALRQEVEDAVAHTEVADGLAVGLPPGC